MAVVAEYNVKGATVKIHDDFLKSKEESLEIMKTVEEKAYRALVAKHNRENTPKTPE